jgi:hypothetical protein
MPKNKDTHLKRAAARLGVGATALAAVGGVKVATVYAHLSGKSQPAVGVALGYCDLLQRINASYPLDARPFRPEDLAPEAIFPRTRRAA